MQLSAAQLGQFERDGYLFIPNLFSPDEIAVLSDELRRLTRLNRPEVLRAATGELRALLAMERYSEPFAALMRHPRLVQPARQILDGPVYMHQYKVVAKDPFGQLDFPWHQDFGSWHAHDGMSEPRAMNFAFFLDDVTEFNGPLCFIPGSHVAGMAQAKAEPLPGATPLYTLDRETVKRLSDRGGMVAPKGPAGSGVFFHGCMAHASGPNLSARTRYILYLTCNHVANWIRRPTRPDYYASRVFTPLEPLADDCLAAFAPGRIAAE